MANSFLIWIPSIQQYLRFKELSLSQYKIILKVISDPTDIEFFYHINEIIKYNIISNYDVNLLTTIDRFIIFIYLKMNSCSPLLTLSKTCDKCKTYSSININLPNLIPILSQKIDKIFKKDISFNGINCECDIPSIKTEYDLFEDYIMTNDESIITENRYTNYVISHIQKMTIGQTNINFTNMSLKDRRELYKNLPIGLTKNIEHNFLLPIHDTLSDVNFIDIKCSGCNEKFTMKFQINTVSDLIRILFKDNSLVSLLMDIFNLSIAGHLDGNFLMTLAPYEFNNMSEFLKESKKSKSEQPKNTDLFESPSEFSNMTQ